MRFRTSGAADVKSQSRSADIMCEECQFHHGPPGEMASRLTTICRNQEIAGSTPAVVIGKPFSLNELRVFVSA